MSALEKPFYTPEEYLEQERKADFKSEYYGGQIFAMSGGTARHGVIGGNVIGLIWAQLGGGSCTVLSSDVKIKVNPTGLFTYPDVSVVCGEIKYHDEAEDVVENPALVVEVLSPSTQNYDRGEKFLHYQSIDTLTDYLLVSQNVMRVEHFTRQSDDQWLFTVYHGPEAVIKIASIGCEMRLIDVYRAVKIKVEKNPLTLHRS